MPTRKQRRRREKDFRHDVRVFEVDEQGNEVPISALRERTPEKAKPAAKNGAKTQAKGSARPAREVPPPSWERALRRGGLMGGLMLVLFVFVFKTGGIVQRVGIGVFYAVAFVPLTYWIDRTAYRTYQRRLQKTAEPKSRR
ncbi:MAG TPA: hypothetical protein VFA82_08910 [Gaiellaceae bacterium]|nr:hypothetical protein [Gaiellaceae bacterium]